MIGLCVGILSLSVFAFIVIPLLKGTLTKPSNPPLVRNGRYIFSDLHWGSRDAINWDDTLWFKIGEYQTSTDCFRAMITNGWLSSGVDFRLFGGKGLKSPDNVFDPLSFSAENNAWCIVVGLNSNTPPETPFLFTRNVGFGSKKEAPRTGATLDQMTGLNKNQMPLQDEACVVITYGGSVKTWPALYATQTNFNPTGSSLTILAP